MTYTPSPEPPTKLQEGLQLLESCQNDTSTAMLGMVLVKVHSALEDHIREILLHQVSLPYSVQQSVRGGGGRNDRRAGWVTLVNLLEKHVGLSRVDRKLILDTNKVRNKFAHGDYVAPTELTLEQLRNYTNFVQSYLDRTKIAPNTEKIPTNPFSTPPSPEPAHHRGSSPKTVQRPRGLPTGTQWVTTNVQAFIYACIAAIVGQWGVQLAVMVVEACHLAPAGSSTAIAKFAGPLMGAAYYFERQGRGLVKNPNEWAIVSVMGVGMIYIPALIMGWIGQAIFPADNTFWGLVFLGGIGAALGLALGIAQYRILRPHYDRIESWIPASVMDWSLCLGFFPLLKFLRPEVQTSPVAAIVLPIVGFMLGKVVTGYQVRQLKVL